MLGNGCALWDAGENEIDGMFFVSAEVSLGTESTSDVFGGVEEAISASPESGVADDISLRS